MKLTVKQKEIIELSKQLFADKGYVETSMRDLAFQLDVNAASIYSHFKSKEEILQIIFNEVYDNMERNMKEIKDMNGNIEEKFLTYIKLHITSIVQNKKSFDIYYKYWNVVDGHMEGRYGLMNYNYFDFIRNLVNEMFPLDVDIPCFIPNGTALFLIDLRNNIPKIINPENPDINMVVEDVQNKLLFGFGKFRK